MKFFSFLIFLPLLDLKRLCQAVCRQQTRFRCSSPFAFPPHNSCTIHTEDSNLGLALRTDKKSLLPVPCQKGKPHHEQSKGRSERTTRPCRPGTDAAMWRHRIVEAMRNRMRRPVRNVLKD